MLLALLGALGWLGLRFWQAGNDDRDPLELAIDDIVETAMAEGHISGVSIAVARGLRVVYARGYGYADLENRLPADPQTVYQVGSITKQLTAAAVTGMEHRQHR
jgi:CubicO group peptidase (beta-lactamase class C family)